ncbi:outer membrane beta-barrel protein [Azotobacter chroococcum]|uniref:outer membrane beta-barrel protein n=1 Tax=Azotobacter chroococcum TaxID=353 RepID=UPI002418521C|nr:outer membrane beta-barrel protein [Azotobacter chroococcum]
MTKKYPLRALTAVLSASTCANAWAVEPQGIKLTDSLRFTPILQVTERYDDNFRAVEEHAESSWITTISPTFILGAEGNKGRYEVKYRSESDIIHSSRDDDNTDHHLTAEAALKFNARNRLKLNAGYHRLEQVDSDNSDNRSNNASNENDKFSTIDAGALYSFGAEGARGQIDLGAKHEKLRYHNRNHVNDDLERESTTLNTIFYYRVAPKTRALLEARYTDYNYVSNDMRNSENVALLGGLTWTATAKTTGTVKIGAEKKRFEESGVDNMSNSMWEIGVDWKPRTYSTFSLTSRQAIDESYESNIGSSAVKTTSTTLEWKHKWSARLSSKTGYTRSEREYEDYDRDDDFDAFELGLTYQVRRWLDIGLGYKYATNDSSREGEGYDRNIYLFSITGSL